MSYGPGHSDTHTHQLDWWTLHIDCAHSPFEENDRPARHEHDPPPVPDELFELRRQTSWSESGRLDRTQHRSCRRRRHLAGLSIGAARKRQPVTNPSGWLVSTVSRRHRRLDARASGQGRGAGSSALQGSNIVVNLVRPNCVLDGA